MYKKVMSVLLSLILVVTSVFVSNLGVFAEEPTETLTVNATSNYFPQNSVTVAEGEEYVTVTYFINSSKNVLDLQWTLSYDPACLECLHGGIAFVLLGQSGKGELAVVAAVYLPEGSLYAFGGYCLEV